MRISELKTTLAALRQARTPAVIWSDPGLGKSAAVAQVAREAEIGLIDLRGALLDAVDLRGIPSPNGDGLTHWLPPAELPRDGDGILFLDEFNRAAPAVQNAMLQLILDLRIGEYVLPDGWTVFAAANDRDSHTTKMGKAMGSRLVHLRLEPHLEDWIAWALNEAIPTELLAFLRFRPGLFHDFDPRAAGNTFPCPRTWEMAARVLEHVSDAAHYEVLSGTVGEGAAAELTGFLRIFRSLPSVDRILMDPHAAPVPDDPATLYALAGALAAKSTEQNFSRIADYCNRLPAEFSVLTIRDAGRRSPEIYNTRAFIEWSARHSDVLM